MRQQLLELVDAPLFDCKASFQELDLDVLFLQSKMHLSHLRAIQVCDLTVLLYNLLLELHDLDGLFADLVDVIVQERFQVAVDVGSVWAPAATSLEALHSLRRGLQTKVVRFGVSFRQPAQSGPQNAKVHDPTADAVCEVCLPIVERRPQAFHDDLGIDQHIRRLFAHDVLALVLRLRQRRSVAVGHLVVWKPTAMRFEPRLDRVSTRKLVDVVLQKSVAQDHASTLLHLDGHCFVFS